MSAVEKGARVFLVILAVFLLACMKGRTWRRRASWNWDMYDRPHRGEPDERRPTVEEEFEKWHRTMHAREHAGKEGDSEQT